MYVAVVVVMVHKSGMSDVSSVVNSDENCWFRREALVCWPPCNFPSEGSGAIPALSYFLLLIKEEILAVRVLLHHVRYIYVVGPLTLLLGNFCRCLYLILSLSLPDVLYLVNALRLCLDSRLNCLLHHG